MYYKSIPSHRSSDQAKKLQKVTLISQVKLRNYSKSIPSHWLSLGCKTSQSYLTSQAKDYSTVSQSMLIKLSSQVSQLKDIYYIQVL